METIAAIFFFFSLVGIFNTGLFLGKVTYRWTLAIDELLRQRRERKGETAL